MASMDKIARVSGGFADFFREKRHRRERQEDLAAQERMFLARARTLKEMGLEFEARGMRQKDRVTAELMDDPGSAVSRSRQMQIEDEERNFGRQKELALMRAAKRAVGMEKPSKLQTAASDALVSAVQKDIERQTADINMLEMAMRSDGLDATQSAELESLKKKRDANLQMLTFWSRGGRVLADPGAKDKAEPPPGSELFGGEGGGGQSPRAAAEARKPAKAKVDIPPRERELVRKVISRPDLSTPQQIQAVLKNYGEFLNERERGRLESFLRNTGQRRDINLAP